MDNTSHTPPHRDDPGFGRDRDLERARLRERPADANLSGDAHKAEQEPTIDYAPDPDADADEGD